MIVAGEDAHHARTDAGGQPRQFRDVLDLELAVRHFAMLEVGCEVGITRNSGGEAPAGETVAKSGTPRLAVIEHAQVRTFGHQQDTRVSERGGLVHKLVDAEKRLSP